MYVHPSLYEKLDLSENRFLSLERERRISQEDPSTRRWTLQELVVDGKIAER